MNAKKVKKSQIINEIEEQEIKNEVRTSGNSHNIPKNRTKRHNNNYKKNDGGRKENAQLNSKNLEEQKKSDIIKPENEDIKDTEDISIDTGNAGEPDYASLQSAKINAEETDDSEKVEIVGVRYKPVGKIYFFSPENEQYSVNDKVVVEPSRGITLGYVVIPNRKVSVSKITQPLKSVQRRATENDIEKVQNNKKLAKQAMAIADERVKAHGLKLKLIEAEYTFDNSKLLYYFTAENRIDFRELVKDLASIFKTRIELRQIGIRDQTKIVGGLSICGRPFCCNSFLQDFEQVTIKMAKEQNIQINSAKISGACGRLMCCLRYEHETYEALCKDIPKVNTIVETPSGETGVVIEINVLAGTCKVRINAKNTEQGVNITKSFSKKELKPIGFVKGESQNNNSNNDDSAFGE